MAIEEVVAFFAAGRGRGAPRLARTTIKYSVETVRTSVTLSPPCLNVGGVVLPRSHQCALPQDSHMRLWFLLKFVAMYFKSNSLNKTFAGRILLVQ